MGGPHPRSTTGHRRQSTPGSRCAPAAWSSLVRRPACA